MGNKTSSLKNKHDDQPNKISKKKSLNNNQSSVDDLVPNLIIGRLVSTTSPTDPTKYTPIQACPVCSKDTINYGLENYMPCEHCGQKMMMRNGNFSIPLNIPENMTDYTDSESVKIQDMENIPDLKKVVLSVCLESIPREMKFAGKVDYNAVLTDVLLPFFQQKPRILKKNIFFAVNNLYFKVLSCSPDWGRISNETHLFCYKEIFMEKPITRVRLNPLTPDHSVTVENIKEFMSKRRFKVHLEKDQTIKINGAEFQVSKIVPHSGVVRETTEYEVKEVLEELRSLTLMSFQDKLPFYVFRSVDVRTLEYSLFKKLVKPFFQGINRFVKKGDTLMIDETEFYVHACTPASGRVTETTQIFHSQYISKAEYKKDHPQQDGIIQDERKLNSIVFRDKNIENRQNRPRRGSNHEENKEENAMQHARHPYIFDNDDLQTLHGDRIRSRDQIPNHNRQYHHRHGNSQQISQQQDDQQIREPESSQQNNELNGRSHNHHSHHFRSQSNMINTNNNMRTLLMGILTEDQNNQRENGQNGQRRNRTPIEGHNRENRENGREERIPLERIRNPDMNGIRIEELVIVTRSRQSESKQQRNRARSKKTTKPATKEQIHRLPIRKIDLEFLKEKSLDSEDYLRCAICIVEYQNEEEIRTLPCLHYFHKNCIDQWLRKNRVCPICKTSILAY